MHISLTVSNINMRPPLRYKTAANEIRHEWLCKFVFTIQTRRFASMFLRFSLLLLLIFNLQTFGEATDFCFDGSNEGKVG